MRNIYLAAAACLMLGPWLVSEAIAEDGISTLSAKHGSTSDRDENSRRADQLKARIKAINEKSQHNMEESAPVAPVPLKQKSVRGSEQIKAKMKAIRESKSGRWLQNWYHNIMKKIETSESKRKATFKEKLAQEKARRLAKKKARENSQ